MIMPPLVGLLVPGDRMRSRRGRHVEPVVEAGRGPDGAGHEYP
ncbi:MAG: hypothetical protein ACYC0W_05030 [Candidatus Nanopelagicales bacterium]